MSAGWIKIERAIVDHWIYQDPWKFRNWCDILLLANHADQKFEIGGTIYTCKQGETLRSLLNLSTRWRCSRSKARRFLKLLEKDGMIRITDERKTTRISVCNYDSYQGQRNASETQAKRKRTQTTMNKNDKKKLFKEGIEPHLEKYGRDLLNEFFAYWTEPTPDGKMRYEKQSAFAIDRRLGTWARNQIKFDNESNKESDQGLTDYLKNKAKK